MNYWLCDNYDSNSLYHYSNTLQIKSIAINENSNGNNVFVCNLDSWVYNSINIYSTDNGETFSLFCKIDRGDATECQLFYSEQDDCLLVITFSPTNSKIYSIDKDKNTKIVYQTENTIKCFDKYFNKKTNKKTYLLVETRKTNSLLDNSAYDRFVETDLYYFNSFDDKTNWQNLAYLLTSTNNGIDNHENFWTETLYSFNWNISCVDIVNETNIYFFHKTYVYTSDTTKHNVYGYIKYENGKFVCIFGYPRKNFTTINNMSWQDSDQGTCYGICGTEQNPNFLLFGTIVGIYFAENNGESVYQCNSNLCGEISLTTTGYNQNTNEITLQKYTSTGIDV